MADSTELLSYALLLFLVFVYLPYAFFTLFAERFIDLGRRRDSTQLEEIISAFLPSLLFHLPVFLLYHFIKVVFNLPWTFDFAAVAGMFGKDRGAVFDYVYGGDWTAVTTYIAMLWLVASLFGLWFGKAAKWVCGQEKALDGVDELKLDELKLEPAESIPLWVKWGGWYPWIHFFHESFVPLYTWHEQHPQVRVETTDDRLYTGKFQGYEKTTDGQLDAIRLSDATCELLYKKASWYLKQKLPLPDVTPIKHVYLKWSHIAEMRVLPPITVVQDQESE